MLGPSQRNELKGILASGVMKAALVEIDEEVASRQEGLMGVDLSSSEGIAKAQELQGTCRGLRRAVEILHDLAKEEDDYVEG